MAKKRYRMGVLTKTFLMFGAGVCGAVVVLSATLFFYMRDTTDLAVQELINSTTSSNARQLNSLIDRIRVAAETLGSNETGYVLPNDNIPAIKQMILFGEPGQGCLFRKQNKRPHLQQQLQLLLWPGNGPLHQ